MFDALPCLRSPSLLCSYFGADILPGMNLAPLERYSLSKNHRSLLRNHGLAGGMAAGGLYYLMRMAEYIGKYAGSTKWHLRATKA